MSHWILEFLIENKSISSIRTDLVPFLVKRQFQSKRYTYQSMPAIEHRKRTISPVEKWLTNPNNCPSASLSQADAPHSVEFLSSCKYKLNEMSDYIIRDLIKRDENDVVTSPRSVPKANACNEVDKNEDLLRCFALIYEDGGVSGQNISTSSHVTPFFQRVTNISAYITLNR